MKRAVIDIVGECLPEAARTLTDAGLKITGSLVNGIGPVDGVIRLIVEDDLGLILPEQCNSGWWLVSPLFTLHSFGTQRMTKLDRVDVVGRLVFGVNGQVCVETAPYVSTVEADAALARKSAILGRIAEGV